MDDETVFTHGRYYSLTASVRQEALFYRLVGLTKWKSFFFGLLRVGIMKVAIMECYACHMFHCTVIPASLPAITRPCCVRSTPTQQHPLNLLPARQHSHMFRDYKP